VQLRPDLIHWEFGALAVGRMYLKELLSCRMVHSFRGYDLNFAGLENPDYYQEVWAQTDGLHLLGNDLWQRAQRRGSPSDQLHVLIPPALDPEKFNPEGREYVAEAGSARRPLRILSVGRLEWKKGYEFALAAVKILVAKGVHCEYRIVGGGEYLEAVAFARHQLGLEEVVHLMGALPHAEVNNHLLWADVFLHAAVSEGFCNAVLEAQAMMLPVVCTDADGLPENVADGDTGFVVPRRHPGELADKMLLLAKDHTRRQQMGQAGRQRVLTHFRLQDQVAAFEGFYQQLFQGQQV
jgi:colanic acid/amylovoran biosynthesis glycosyltransferase